VLNAIDQKTDNTVFLYSNTAKTSFYGLVEERWDFLKSKKKDFILKTGYPY
jgi:hypothetical protein